jgi:hypothetical protein
MKIKDMKKVEVISEAVHRHIVAKLRIEKVMLDKDEIADLYDEVLVLISSL